MEIPEYNSVGGRPGEGMRPSPGVQYPASGRQAAAPQEPRQVMGWAAPRPLKKASIFCTFTILVLAGLAATSSGALAAQSPRRLEFWVLDSSHMGIPHPRITLTYLKTGQTYYCHANSIGRCEITLSSKGQYELVVAAEGFREHRTVRGDAPRKQSAPHSSIFVTLERATVDANNAVARFDAALRFGNVDDVASLLASGAVDVNAFLPSNPFTGSLSPLMKAAYYGHVKAVSHLLKSGANVNARDKDGRTALLLAAANLMRRSSDEFSVVDFLVHWRADVNIAANDGETPLLAAIRAGELPLASRLLEWGASAKAVSNTGEPAFALAAEWYKLAVTYKDPDQLLSATRYTPALSSEPTVRDKFASLLRRMLDAGADLTPPNAPRTLGLAEAADRRDKTVLNMIADHPVTSESRNLERALVAIAADPVLSGSSFFLDSHWLGTLAFLDEAGASCIGLLLTDGARLKFRSEERLFQGRDVQRCQHVDFTGKVAGLRGVKVLLSPRGSHWLMMLSWSGTSYYTLAVPAGRFVDLLPAHLRAQGVPVLVSRKHRFESPTALTEMLNTLRRSGVPRDVSLYYDSELKAVGHLAFAREKDQRTVGYFLTDGRTLFFRSVTRGKPGQVTHRYGMRTMRGIEIEHERKVIVRGPTWQSGWFRAGERSAPMGTRIVTMVQLWSYNPASVQETVHCRLSLAGSAGQGEEVTFEIPHVGFSYGLLNLMRTSGGPVRVLRRAVEMVGGDLE